MVNNNHNNKSEDSSTKPELLPIFPAVGAQETFGGYGLRWAFTQHHFKDEAIQYKTDKLLGKTNEETLKEFAEKYCEWMIFGHETGKETMREHLQGGFILKTRRTHNWIKMLTNKQLHFELMKKHPLATYRYCTKEDICDFYEHGSDWFIRKYIDKPKKSKTERSEKYKKALNAAKNNSFEDIDPELLIKNYNNLLKIRDMCYKVDVVPNLFLGGSYGDFFHNHFMWLRGDTGVLKSYNASVVSNSIYDWLVRYCKQRKLELPREELYKEPYKKKLTKWWNNYKFQKVVIIEEATKDFVKNYISHIKIWFDQYAFPAEYKGGEIGLIRPEFIIVTSNYSLDDCFLQEGIDYDKDYLPIKRRFKELGFAGSERKMLMWPSNNLLRVEYDLKEENRLYQEEFIKCMNVLKRNDAGKTNYLIPENISEITPSIIKDIYDNTKFSNNLEDSVIEYQEYCKENNIEIKSAYFRRNFKKNYPIFNNVNSNNKRELNSSDEVIIVNESNKKIKQSVPEESNSNTKLTYFEATDEELKNYVYEEGKPIPTRYKYWSLSLIKERFGKK